jgi:hypothetical protein
MMKALHDIKSSIPEEILWAAQGLLNYGIQRFKWSGTTFEYFYSEQWHHAANHRIKDWADLGRRVNRRIRVEHLFE